MYQGGGGTLAEARRRQLTDLRCSKLQKKVFTHMYCSNHTSCSSFSTNASLKISAWKFILYLWEQDVNEKKYKVPGPLTRFSEL